MDFNYRVDKNILYIELDGRIDATNAKEVEDKIFEIKAANEGTHTVLDADKLAYISSAGLRVVLKLKKAEPEIAIINVSPEVYEVFEMTGFTEMVTIEKVYPRMSVDGCDFLAKGANGAVYRYNDETIVKVYFGKDSLPEIVQERANARKAFVLGINTAIPYGIVRVNDGYGTVTELLNAVSLSKLVKKNPDNLEEAVNYYVDMIKHIHSIEVAPGELPDNKETVLGWIEYIKPYLDEADYTKLYNLVSELENKNTVLHGDYHTNNIMIQNDEAVLIDLDTLSTGHPILEFGYMYNAFIGFSDLNPLNVLDFLGFPIEVSTKFWRLSLEKYFNTTDEEFINDIENKAKLIGYIRLYRRAIRYLDDENREEKIVLYKEKLLNALSKIETLNF